MNNRKVLYLFIGLFFIALIIGSFVHAAEKNVSSGKQILIAQAKGKKGGPPDGKKGFPPGKGGPPGLKGKGKGGKKGGMPIFGLRPTEDRKQIYDRKGVFLILDNDKNQFVSPKEYDGPPKMFKEMDSNNDGKLSFEEAKWMMTFSDIPSGSFMMGSENLNLKEDTRPVHRIEIDAFKMGTTEVTTAQFCQYLNAALKAGEIIVELGDAGGGGTRIFIPVPAYVVYGAPGTTYAGKILTLLSPVAGVSHIKAQNSPLLIPEHPLNQNWIDYVPDMKRFYTRSGFEDWPAAFIRGYGAASFVEHYGISLPTEAEWEYVASGGKQFEFATGDGTNGCDSANYRCYNVRQQEGFTGADTMDEYIGYRIKVGSYPPNPFGVFDLAGNVWEFCIDWYREDFYQYCVDNGIKRNPINLVGEEPPDDGSAKGGPMGGWTHDTRVMRGGSYNFHEAVMYTANRNPIYWLRGNDHFGFRVVMRDPSTVFNGK